MDYIQGLARLIRLAQMPELDSCRKNELGEVGREP